MFFKSSLQKKDYFSDTAERIYIHMRDSKDNNNELEKQKRNDPNIILEINTKENLA